MASSFAFESTDINAVFPNKVCINLDRRPERWEQAQQEFARHEINAVRRFPAFDGQALIPPTLWKYTRGAYGCLLSHLEIVRHARQQKLPSILIFEDDVAFDTDFRGKFARYIHQVPTDWDMLFFGAIHRDDPIRVSSDLCRITQAHSTFAYALNHTVFDKFIAVNSAAHLPVDVANFRLQKESPCYCFMPFLAWVQAHYSDAQERFDNHWYLKESIVLFGRDTLRFVANSLLILAFTNPNKSQRLAENVIQLARIHSTRLSGIRLSIVEQGNAPTIDSHDLAANCDYVLVKRDGRLDRGACFNTAVRNSDPSRDVVVFLDGEVFLEGSDITGNIAMCHRYDGTTGFDRMYELTEQDNDKLFHDGSPPLRWFDPDKYVSSRKNDCFSHCCCFNRRSFQKFGGWAEDHPENLTLRQGLFDEQRLRLFQSPNNALRLSHKS